MAAPPHSKRYPHFRSRSSSTPNDFEDYRDVGGTKFPFRVRVSLVDPWTGSTRQYNSVQLGATIDDAVFVMPK